MSYEPTDQTTDAVCDAAFICGRDLDPDDPRSEWINVLPAFLRGDAEDAYHAGQAERYECEDW
tara:strand:- start:59 stop:247 length:189 start_codon:yes stop_codon:yes gene_type:complete